MGEGNLSLVQDYMIYQLLTRSNGKATKQEIFKALGKTEDAKKAIEEKLSMMERFGLISVEGDFVTLKKR